ncbi:unnamed protein product, partial [marine sediment metagenome]
LSNSLNENSRKNSRPDDVSRRTFLNTAAAASAAILAAPYIKSARAAERKITVRDPGGPFTAGFKAAYYDPFKAETGIEVVGIQGEHEPTGMIKAMIEAKNYTWDGALLSKSAHQSLVNLGYLEPISPTGGPGKHVSEVPESLRGEFILGNDVYATLIAYRKDVLGDKGPKNWADFWNTDKIPGARALRKHPFVKDRPAVTASIMTRSSIKIHEWIASQQYDIGLAEMPPHNSGLNIQPISLECVCALRKDDPLATKPYLTPDD